MIYLASSLMDSSELFETNYRLFGEFFSTLLFWLLWAFLNQLFCWLSGCCVRPGPHWGVPGAAAVLVAPREDACAAAITEMGPVANPPLKWWLWGAGFSIWKVESTAPALQGCASPVDAFLPLTGAAAAPQGFPPPCALCWPIALPAVETFVFTWCASALVIDPEYRLKSNFLQQHTDQLKFLWQILITPFLKEL